MSLSLSFALRDILSSHQMQSSSVEHLRSCLDFLHSATLCMIVVNSSLTQTMKSYVSTNTDFITNHDYSLSPLYWIDKFQSYYSDSFPHASIAPKLHMLEDHVVPFLQRWKVGFGFLGEQGAESIHARFNSIRKNCSNMPNSVTRLEAI